MIDSNGLSSWLSRLQLSSRLAKYSSLLSSVNPLSNVGSETAQLSTGSVVASPSDVMSQESTARTSFVRSQLPDVGLNSLMSMKRSIVRSPRSLTGRHCLPIFDRTLPSCSIASSTTDASQCCLTAKANTTCSLLATNLSTGMSFADVMPKSDFTSVLTLAAATKPNRVNSGHPFSIVLTDTSSDLLKLSTVPSLLTPDVDSVFFTGASAAVETPCGNYVSTSGIFSDSSPNELGKTLPPAKRPQSLDVIPWSPLSRSPCTLTGSLSTVGHSQVVSSNSSSLSAATELVPASPVNISAL